MNETQKKTTLLFGLNKRNPLKALTLTPICALIIIQQLLVSYMTNEMKHKEPSGAAGRNICT
jgi:hypothetical protein